VTRLAARLRGDAGAVRMRGLVIPRAARELELSVRVAGPSAIVRLAVQRSDGTFVRLLPARELRAGRHRLVAAVEVSAPGDGTVSDVAEIRPGPLRARLANGSAIRLDSDDLRSAGIAGAAR
jgi:hypothetical protein